MQPFGASRKFYVSHLLAPVNAGIKFSTGKDVTQGLEYRTYYECLLWKLPVLCTNCLLDMLLSK